MSVLEAAVSNLATTAKSIPAPLSDPVQTTHSLIAVLGLALVAIGTRFLFNPAAAQQEFGLAHSTDEPPRQQRLTLLTGWVGLRDVAVGAVLLVLGQLVETAVVGWAVVAVAALPLMDAAVAWRHKAERAKMLQHFATAGFCALLGCLLIMRG